MERQVAELLQWAGDHGGAFLWRRICRDLSGGLRIGVASRDAAVSQRLIDGLSGVDRVEWVPLVLGDAEASLGAQDRLLGVHALLWATNLTAPLGAQERAAIEDLVSVGSPSRAAVVLADWHLLDKLSDDPESEGTEIRERAGNLLPEDWALMIPDELGPWVDEARGDLWQLVRERRSTISQMLLTDAVTRATSAIEEAERSLAEVQGLVDAEDAALEEIRTRGKRAATHLLSAVKRQTQRLQVDLGEFLHELEGRLPVEIESIEDLGLLRHALPHWLQHVVERWLGDRLGQWRADVSADLTDLPLTDDDLVRAELLVPAVQPPLIAGERDWTTRLGATAALGSGAALLMLGLWAPALLFVGGGLGFSALRTGARKARTRQALLESATLAVRQLGPELNKVLEDQVRATEDALGDLGDERAQAHAEAQLDVRSELERQLTARTDKLAELQRQHDDLTARIAELRGAAK